jgi:hypothetical protein
VQQSGEVMLTQSAFHLCSQLLRQIHPVRDCNDEQLRISQSWPIEEVVHNILFGGEKLIKLIHEHHADR